ncbi:hypothetical protein LV716_06495 [Flagellimonas sp. HMM57]|uniref:hypothetical protein n=1 Tax=unclassified Flagellimonas TaxID=2644544 RepID=UPI0013D22A87|nr:MULTISPECIES: hypothetical protein [unclassified Flagellimonas]UII77417.1 hypothetical protein LV716_06495 [Flagellimonas sp. HMM57]
MHKIVSILKVVKKSILSIVTVSIWIVGIMSCNKTVDKSCDSSKGFKKYVHNVEYISPNEARLNEGFKLCNERRIGQYYNPEKATYSKGKNGLRKFILTNYTNKGYSDSGYLNIRFVINCHGKAGRYIIHENDLDLNPKKLNEDMVEQIFQLTTQLKNWNPNFIRDEFWDSYIYLSYRIENGEIVEILP